MKEDLIRFVWLFIYVTAVFGYLTACGLSVIFTLYQITERDVFSALAGFFTVDFLIAAGIFVYLKITDQV